MLSLDFGGLLIMYLKLDSSGFLAERASLTGLYKLLRAFLQDAARGLYSQDTKASGFRSKRVDPKLQWKEHIQKATTKGHAAFEALSRITASTWGPSMRPSRLIYTAVIRPTMLYGSRIWGMQSNGEPTATSTLQPIRRMQNRR